MSNEDGNISYSVVIPVFNEKPNILPLYRELKPVMEKIGKKYEILFIDDGSKDGTYFVIKRLHDKDKKVKAIRLRKNFGQTAAISAGFDHAKGEVIITMDGDLQNDPRDIPRLLSKLNQGYDVVSGWRYNRKDPGLSKKIPSKISNRLASRMTGLKLHDYGCTLKAYRKSALSDLKLYGEMHRYIPAVLHWQGFKVAEIKVRHHPRTKGQTKYGAKRLFRGLFDLFNFKFWSGYSTRPLHFFGGIGIVSFLAGFFISLYLVILRFLYNTPLEDRPLLLLGALFIILGIQLIMFGFLGEMIVRVYYDKTGRKTYVLAEELGKE
ncbi:MAG: glycosyltransferase family 2 protein [Thermoplasmata archaeon]|nr:MAG: glycosyltransferase family 2 protein [Thermoplasmata archaeon]